MPVQLSVGVGEAYRRYSLPEGIGLRSVLLDCWSGNPPSGQSSPHSYSSTGRVTRPIRRSPKRQSAGLLLLKLKKFGTTVNICSELGNIYMMYPLTVCGSPTTSEVAEYQHIVDLSIQTTIDRVWLAIDAGMIRSPDSALLRNKVYEFSTRSRIVSV